MAGATAGAASTFAGSDDQRRLPEVRRDERRGAERRRAGERRGLGEATRHTAADKAVANAPGQNEDRDHRREAQLPADVLDRARVEGQRHGDGQQQGMPARRGPPGEHRYDPGGAHHPARSIDGPLPASGT